MCKITVFTPAYNRAHTLHRVYESLKKQSFKDFEWIIVDDGSSDNTKQIVDEWTAAENFFSIIYHYQKNQGKHIATNYAVSIAKGEFFVTLDSDDGCKETALDVLLETWDSIPEKNRHLYKGVACRCSSLDRPDDILGTLIPYNERGEGYLDSNDNDIRLKYKVKGELWGMTRTAVLRDNPYPTESGLHFYPENVYWGRIGDKYVTRYINTPLRLYYLGSADQATSKGKINYNEFYYQRIYFISDLINEGYFKYSPTTFVKQAIGLIRDGLLSGRTYREIFNNATSVLGKALLVIATPAGTILYIRNKRKQG